MASETTNYKLVKPDPEEFYDVGVQNSNLDKIDTALKELEDNKIESVNGKTGKNVQITSGDIHNIDPLPVTAYATAYQTGHSVMFIPANNEYSVGWRESLGLDTSINWYLIVEYFKTTSNNGYQKVTAYRLGSNLPNAIFMRNSTGSTSWNNWKRIFTSDDITDSTTTDDSTKVASAKAVKTVNDNLTQLQQTVTSHSADNVRHLDYAVANGTNTYTASVAGILQLIEGMSLKVKFTNANTSASTLNINGLGAKPIKKSNGNDLSSGNIKAGQILHLVYTGSNFQLLGEGGEYGNVTPDKVLEGVTFGTENGIVTGTMPNRGTVNHSLAINGTYTIPAGYHSGSGKITQSIPTKGAATYTPTTTNQTIAAGQYLSGVQTIKGDSNLIPANIKQGVSIFGVTGTLTPESMGGKRFALGTSSAVPGGRIESDWDWSYAVLVSGLDFTPKFVHIVSGGDFPHSTIYNSYYMGNRIYASGAAPTLGYDFYVNNNGFKLPVVVRDGVTKFNWIAIG